MDKKDTMKCIEQALERGDMGEANKYRLADPKPFVAEFKRLADLEEVADEINQPHEDYPMRCSVTWKIIKDLLSVDFSEQPPKVSEFTAKQIHSLVMWDLESRGSYRSINVRINDYHAPDHLKVPELISKCFPVVARTDDGLKAWYEKFQIVHPFEDGNGRVGGIIVAALSYDGKTYMAPMQ